jgi:hypothetical protein
VMRQQYIQLALILFLWLLAMVSPLHRLRRCLTHHICVVMGTVTVQSYPYGIHTGRDKIGRRRALNKTKKTSDVQPSLVTPLLRIMSTLSTEHNAISIYR